MRVLGIDPGSETLGWGVLDVRVPKYQGVAYGTIRPPKGLAFSKRLLKVHEGVAEVIERYSPNVLSIEDSFFSRNARVAIKLGQVRGVILLLGEQTGLEIAEYSPRLIKSTVVGYGNAEKMQVQEMVRVLLKLRDVPKPHDAADALAAAICHVHHCGPAGTVRSAAPKSL